MIKKICIYQRAINVANYVIETNATVRAAAQHFGISKSTVYNDLTQRLPEVSPILYSHYVRPVLEKNKQERSSRANEAKRKKYTLY